jgi:hypothetical protein
MTFWVQENKKQCYAKVHRSTCSSCKNGKGPKDNAGYWHGPFAEFNEAVEKAKSIKKNIDNCKLCRPQN